ncbi:MAG: hypothetical protein Q9207_007457 [Kuettlingeria erythrocarpa]
MAPAGALFVVGSCSMIGSAVAQHFAERAFSSVALFFRQAYTLATLSAFIERSDSDATIRNYTVDIADRVALTKAVEQAISELGDPEVVAYADHSTTLPGFSTLGVYPPEKIVKDFEVANIALYTTATVLMPHLQRLAQSNPAAHPCFFVNSEVIAYRPQVSNFSKSMAKAAQANLLKALAEENKGVVHIALVVVGGPINFFNPLTSPTYVGSKFWDLYLQDKGHWGFEMNCGW